MLFNSPTYAVFLPLVVLAFFACPRRLRWVVLLSASYYFYGSWEPKYLLLILLCTGSSYGAALAIERAERQRSKRLWLISALGLNLGVLFLFKYYQLAADTVTLVLGALHSGSSIPILDWLLPVGISFYTFQALGYVVDVYRGDLKAERHAGHFALYVAYFPQLVAGPIERAKRLLPQLKQPSELTWSRLTSGLELIVVGLFKKMVVADRLAIYVDQVYDHPGKYEGAPIVVATYLFAFQIYCDFSGYSDIAVGSARLLGHDLVNNFDRPYAATSVRDFWRRWHISLSTWFRDYVYMPLGGSRVASWRWVRNIAIVFLVSGLWHGAAWTFVLWGALHGGYFVASRLSERARARLASLTRIDRVPVLQRAFQRLVVFNLVCAAWVFFRASSFDDAITLFSRAGLQHASFAELGKVALGEYELALALASLVVLEVWHLLPASAERQNIAKPLRWGVLYAMCLSLLLFAVLDVSTFIYFQF